VCTVQAPSVRQLHLTAMIGGNVTLPCRTTLKTPVNWYYSPPEKSDDVSDKLICKDGNILNSHSRRMTLNRNVRGDFSLAIRSVTREDEGLYICRENRGRGLEHQIKLTIDGKSLSKFYIIYMKKLTGQLSRTTKTAKNFRWELRKAVLRS